MEDQLDIEAILRSSQSRIRKLRKELDAVGIGIGKLVTSYTTLNEAWSKVDRKVGVERGKSRLLIEAGLRGGRRRREREGELEGESDEGGEEAGGEEDGEDGGDGGEEGEGGEREEGDGEEEDGGEDGEEVDGEEVDGDGQDGEDEEGDGQDGEEGDGEEEKEGDDGGEEAGEENEEEEEEEGNEDKKRKRKDSSDSDPSTESGSSTISVADTTLHALARIMQSEEGRNKEDMMKTAEGGSSSTSRQGNKKKIHKAKREAKRVRIVSPESGMTRIERDEIGGGQEGGEQNVKEECEGEELPDDGEEIDFQEEPQVRIILLEQQLKRHEERMNKVLERLDNNMNERFEREEKGMMKVVEELENRMNKRAKKLERDMHKRVEKLENRMSWNEWVGETIAYGGGDTEDEESEEEEGKEEQVDDDDDDDEEEEEEDDEVNEENDDGDNNNDNDDNNNNDDENISSPTAHQFTTGGKHPMKTIPADYGAGNTPSDQWYPGFSSQTTLLNSDEVAGAGREHELNSELPENDEVMNDEAVEGEEGKKGVSEIGVEDGGDRSARNCQD